ncbi:MAG: TrbI/VirB10 family protein, partial [Candidatus Eremiobacteraeota bacterium]|nr:TrbI/VirB10 family protein [Candidatus Eremiobacteraeota bacterium]
GAAGGAAGAGGSGGAGGGASATTAAGRGGAGHTQSTAYLDGPSGQYAVQGANINLPEGGSPKDILQAQRFAPVSKFEIVASSIIPASLITGIDSTLPGLVSALVREDVYDSHTGKYLLIPRGSRLVGVYDNQVQYGQSRLLVAWQRLIFPDTTSIDLLNMPGNDSGGYAGFGGNVDNHFGLIFNAVLLTSAFAVGAELASPQTGGITYNQSTGQLVTQSVGSNIAQTGTNIVNKDLSIPPTIHIAPGYPFFVFVDRDIVLPGVYHNQ